MKSRQEQAVDIAKLFISCNKDVTYKEVLSFLNEHGFDQELSKHGANMCGVDWNQKAAEYAKQLANTEYSISYGDMLKEMLKIGYPYAQSLYAVDHCGVNWNDQAIDNAIVHGIDFPLSYPEMYEYLKDTCGYPDTYARYGVDHCNIDWCMQARKATEQYLAGEEYIPFEHIIERLKERGFKFKQIIIGLRDFTVDENAQAVKAAYACINADYRILLDDVEHFLQQQEFTPDQIQHALSKVKTEIKQRVEDNLLHVDEMSYNTAFYELISEGYKPDRARRILDSLGEKYWNKRALEEAELLLVVDDTFTDADLKAELIKEGYTEEQAQYAMEHLSKRH